MSNKSKFKSNKSNFKGQKRMVRHKRFDRHGHLIDTMLKPENSSKLEDNLNNVIDFTTNEIFSEVEEFVSNYEKFRKTWDNTSIVDDAGNEVSAEAKQEARLSLIDQGTNDTLNDVLENNGERYTKETFFKRAYKNILDRLDFLRTNAEKDNEKTQENTSKSLVSSLKKVKVFARDIISMFEADKKATQAYEQKITDKAPTVKSKVLWNKVKQHKYKIAASFASVILLTACVADNNKASEKQENPTEQKKAVKKSTPAPVKTQEVKDNKANEVVVQTEYSDSLGISEKAWKRTKEFFGDKYEVANKRLTDQIMKEHFDGLTREYVLNQITYNLHTYADATICSWENALNSGKAKDDKSAEEKVKAYRVAELFFCYLTAQSNDMPENLSDLFIAQKRGDKIVNVNVVNRTCGELEIKFETVQSKKKEEKEEAPADTLTTPKGFGEGAGSVDLEKKTEQSTSVVEGEYTEIISNEQFKDGKETGGAKKEKVLGLNVKDKEFSVEQKGNTKSDNNDKATYNMGNTLNDGEAIAQTNNGVATSVSVPEQNLMVEQEGSTDSTEVQAPTNLPKKFGELDDGDNQASANGTEAQAPTNLPKKFGELDDGDNQAAADAAQAEKTDGVQNSSSSQKVIEGLEGVEPGTPALGNVAPRGGYNHTGVRENSSEYSTTFLGGETAYNDAITNGENHPEWFARNGLAEGRTPQILAEITATYCAAFPYTKETLILRQIVVCGETVSAEEYAIAKAAIEKANIDHTIDGVDYNQSTHNLGNRDKGCDEKLAANIVSTNNTKVTHPSGKKYGLFFVETPKAPTGFGTGAGSLEIVNIQEIVAKAASFTYNKSNESFKAPKTLGEVDVSKVFGLGIKDREFQVETSRSGQSSNGVATLNRSNEEFANSQNITTVPLDSINGKRTNDDEFYVEKSIAQAYRQKNIKTPD